MGSINLLDSHVANLIAAGEVVDRPGSVVKELVENAIDAGATTVTVEIRNGGISFMRVTDNGCGMSSEDVPNSIKRHATSKIKEEKDLDSIETLGFRGEALAAISSVSKLRIMSKRIEDRMGTLLECHGSEVIEVAETGCQNGTTIIIEELFYNVPARRKFLKKDASESMYVTAVMERMCLSRPDIIFKYIIDGAMKFATPGSGKLMDAIYTIFGREFAGKLIPISTSEDLYKVSGFIGSPENTKGNSNMQLFFVNGRFVKSKTAYAAIKQAFDSYIPSGRHATCVINIELDPMRVDCNVHPSKLEVKFSNEKMVFDLIYFAVRSALIKKIQRPQTAIGRENQKLINAFVPIEDNKIQVKQSQITMSEMRLTPDNSVEQEKDPIPLDELKPNESYRKKYLEFASPEPIRQESAIEEKVKEKPMEDFSWDDLPVQKPKPPRYEVPYYKIIGEAFNSYVIVELRDKIIFIDKHAAHERILFEEMKENMSRTEIESQMMLVPIEVALDPVTYVAISEYADDIRKIGLDIKLDEENAKVFVQYVPTVLKDEDVPAFIQSLGSKLADTQTTVGVSKQILYEKALYQASCKAAVKAGREYDMEHIKWICDRLLALPFIKYCPHGRPVAFEVTKYELEKQFKRI